MTYQPKFKFWDGKTMSRPMSLDDLAYEGFPSQFVDEHGDSVKGAIALQFTGMLDKKGVEVYTGDKVKLRGAAYGPQNGVVIFSEKATKFAVRIRRDGYSKNETHLISLLQCEVVGNIYENQE